MEISNEVYESLIKYFSTLSNTGYISYDQVDKLLVFSFIEEILSGPMSYFINEDDYKYISNCLYCLYGTCMIPFPSYKKSVDEPIKNLYDEYRVTSTGLFRATESYRQRIKS